MRRVAMLTAVTVLGGVLLSAPAAGGGGCYADGEPTSGRGFKGPSVPIDECMFTPTVLYVDPGTSVTWINKDPVAHTVSGASLAWGTEEHLTDGDHVTHVFKNEGVFPYYCLLHPSMVGAVVVGDPADSKAAAAPVETDVEMLLGSDTKAEAEPEIQPAAASAPVASTGATGAPWLWVLGIAALGVTALGVTALGVTRARFDR
ncbi:MAG: cupredoxin domain-containing protein [Actinomycetota bacterium]